ncbi:hypothetical protein VHEMI01904 [[Torrubiella] hemipterigena]|uniref:Uncharacterized protein n=1 Tax=[Torrubiella] hemipterigena TaxID=1531966 RepID=A0A0A1SN47_9HYPO|nr:hypothetical protein VHEMI01904 [[Torrubiella] hemipterigena]
MSNRYSKPGSLGLHAAFSIDSWRHSVPSRLERPDPFGDDGFGTRPSTRLTFREPDTAARSLATSTTRIGFLKSVTSIFRRNKREKTIVEPASSSHTMQDSVMQDERGLSFMERLVRKRKSRSPSPEPMLLWDSPLHLNFLFVGGKGCGQTSLLYRARYGYFPNATVVSRSCYETYICNRTYNSQQVCLEL